MLCAYPTKALAIWGSENSYYKNYCVSQEAATAIVNSDLFAISDQPHTPHRYFSLQPKILRLTHKLNRHFVQTDDATNHSKQTATAFTVSKTSHNSRKKLLFANP